METGPLIFEETSTQSVRLSEPPRTVDTTPTPASPKADTLEGFMDELKRHAKLSSAKYTDAEKLVENIRSKTREESKHSALNIVRSIFKCAW